jgi:hypothetical protein
MTCHLRNLRAPFTWEKKRGRHRPICRGLVAGSSEISSARKESSESYECRERGGDGGYDIELLLRAKYSSLVFKLVDIDIAVTVCMVRG